MLGWRIERIIKAESACDGAGGSRNSAGAGSGGEGVDIECSTCGRSVSYAVVLNFAGSGADAGAGENSDDDANSNSAYLVFCGLTGQAVPARNETEVYKVFAMLSSGRIDAD